MGKTRDLFKKIRDTKGTFHVKMGTIKDRNGMDLTEAEDIKRCLALGERSYHCSYLGHEDLFCIILLCILATS